MRHIVGFVEGEVWSLDLVVRRERMIWKSGEDEDEDERFCSIVWVCWVNFL